MSLGPAALVRSIPGALGREPADDLVLVGLSSIAPDAASVVAVDLDGIDAEDTAEEVAAWVMQAVGVVRGDGASLVIVIVYADDAMNPDSAPARLGATAAVTAEADGLVVLDSIAVSRGRWRSYYCTIPSCCPPDGSPITGGPTP